MNMVVILTASDYIYYRIISSIDMPLCRNINFENLLGNCLRFRSSCIGVFVEVQSISLSVL